MTHAHDTIQTAAALAGSNEALIRRHTGLTEEEIYWTTIDAGLSYLYHSYGTNRPRIEQLIGSRFYWNWFFAQWRTRDAEFVAYHCLHECTNGETPRPARNVLQAYIYWHNKALNSELFHRSFSYLIERRHTPQLFTV